MAYELTGKIKLIQDEQSFPSGFSKREMVVTVEDGNYPQDISLEFVKDKARLLDDLQPGEEVTVSFDIRGREHNGRYYNNLQAWKIRPADGDARSADQPPAAASSSSPDLADFDDVPF